MNLQAVRAETAAEIQAVAQRLAALDENAEQQRKTIEAPSVARERAAMELRRLRSTPH